MVLFNVPARLWAGDQLSLDTIRMLPPKVTAVGVASLFSNLALQGQDPLERALLTAVLYQLILSEFYEIKVARLHLVWILTVAVVSESTLEGR